MTKYKATGKVKTLGDLYNSLDSDFKKIVDEIIDNNGDGCCVLRLLRIPARNFQTPSKLLNALFQKYDKENHCFNINGMHLNITLEDVLYLTGLPIKDATVISKTSRDNKAFGRVFTPPVGKKLIIGDLKNIAKNTSKTDKERLVALLLIIIVCFIAPVCEDYVVHNYLVQFVENLDKVNGYSWGAAFLAFFYCAIEKTKLSVDGNCWPFLAFFCIRIPKLGEALDFDINLENHQAPLLEACMMPMKRFSTNKIYDCEDTVLSVLADLKDEDIIWHPYDESMLDERMRLDHLPFVTYLGPMICMNFVADHRPLSHLKQFKGHEEYVGRSIKWTASKIYTKKTSGASNQDELNRR